MRLPIILLSLALLCLGANPSSAATESGSAAAEVTAVNPASAPAASDFDADRATAAYLASMSSQARARSDAYFEGGYWLLLWDLIAGLLIAWILLEGRWSARMRDWAQRLTRRRWLQSALYAIQYLVISTALLLPWSAYEGYFREHQYGMSNQTLFAWLGDQFKGLLLAVILGSLAVTAVYAVIRRAARTWWLWGSIVAMMFLILTMAIGPTYLEPIFNSFYPLADSPLKQQILSLARANEIPATQIYEFDASKQTTKISAHVSGLIGSAQISLNDNLINRAAPEEVRAVLGHEMGHYVMNHTYKALLAYGVVAVIGFAIVRWSFNAVTARYGSRWGLQEVSDVAGLPLLVALFSIYLFILTPLLNTETRVMEAEADAFGLNAAREPDGFAAAALHLSEYRKMQPGPIEEFVFFDHPSGWNRIHRAMIWKAENISAPDIVSYDAAHHPLR
jgi:STE24 endopeptidase